MSRWLAVLLLGGLVAGCAPTVTTGAFTQVGRIETELKRGLSTKMDVRRVLGAPKGTGGMLFSDDPRPREVWFYSDIAATGVTSEGGGVFRVKVREQVLIVFFVTEVLDGFMWYSIAGVATAE